MKYVICILAFICFVYLAKGQNNPSGFPTQNSTGWFRHGWDQSDSGTILAPRLPNFTPRFPGTTILYQNNGVDTTIHYWTGGRWIKLTPGFDSASMSNRINLKLNISDTAAMLLPYLRKADTANKWVQDVYVRNDSLFKFKNGAETFLDTLNGGGGGSGTVTSIGLSMPSAFTVTNSPITTNGTIAVTGAGTSLQYIRGNGTLATFDTTAIPSFYTKVRSLISNTSPITYNSTTGVIGINNANTSGTKGAASFNSSSFSDNGSGLISLLDIVSGSSCTNCDITFNSKGQITSATNGTLTPPLANASGAGDTLLINDTIKRLNPGFGINHTANTTSITTDVDSTVIATQYDLTQLSQTVLNNIGSGFRLAATPSGNIKTIFGSNTITVDSSSNSNALTFKADTSVLATQYDIIGFPSGSATTNQVAYWTTATTIGGDPGMIYNASTNYLTVDTVRNKKNITDTTRYLPSVLVPNGARTSAIGDSYTVGSAASPILDSAYIYRFGNYYNMPIDNYAVTGVGAITSTYNHFVNVNYPNPSMTSAMFGLNNLRYGGNDIRTFRKVVNGYKNVFCNQFSKTFYPASNGSPITRSSGWTTGWASNSGGGKAGTQGAFTSTLNSYIEYAFTDSTVWFSVIAGNGSGSIYTSPVIEVKIDGVVVENYDLNNQTDGQVDGSFDGRLMPVTRYYTGLSYSAHTIRVTNKSAGLFLLFDGFSNLIDRGIANTYLLYHVPKMSAAGYATAPANSSNAITDTCNVKIDSLVATFPSWYPVYKVAVNNYYNTATDVSGDNVHPSNQGHRHIFDAAVATLGSSVINVENGSLFYSNGALYLKNDTAIEKVAVGDVVYNQGQTIFNDTMRIGAFNDKPVAFISNGATIASFHKGANYCELLGNTRIFGNLQASTGQIVIDNNDNVAEAGVTWKIGRQGGLPGILANSSYTGISNSKYWYDFYSQNGRFFSVVNDAGTFNANVRFLEIKRNGTTIDSVTFPHGKFFIGEMTRTTTPDSVLTWDVSTQQVRLAPKGTTTTLYTGDGTLAGNRTVTANNLNLTFDDVQTFRINYDTYIQSKADGTFPYTNVIVAPSQQLWIGYTPTAGTYSKGSAIVIDTNNNVSLGTSTPPTTAPLYADGAAYVHGFQSGRGNFYRVSDFSADHTMTNTEYWANIDASGGNVTITLPAASTVFGSSMGIQYVFKRTDASGNTVTIQRAGSDTIDGATSFTIVGQYTVKEVQCVSATSFAVR